jgi:transcriptional regulator with XRE-family HTH domain
MSEETMVIGDRLKAIRESKNLSQGDIEKRTGLLRCYISRVENGHTVPAIETLEKLTRAMEVPLYQLFYEGDSAEVLKMPKDKNRPSSKDSRMAESLRSLFARMRDRDQKLVLHLARKLART